MQPTSLDRCPSPRPPLGHAGSLQHPLETALARSLAIQPQIQLPDLARSPAGMPFLQTHHLTHLPLSQRSRTVLRPPRFFPQPLCSPKHQTLSPLVAGSCRNSILPAQRSKVSPFQRPQSKLDSLLHRFTLFPWHPEVLTSSHHSKSVTYVLNLLCIRCPEPAPQPRSPRLFSSLFRASDFVISMSCLPRRIAMFLETGRTIARLR